MSTWADITRYFGGFHWKSMKSHAKSTVFLENPWNPWGNQLFCYKINEILEENQKKPKKTKKCCKVPKKPKNTNIFKEPTEGWAWPVFWFFLYLTTLFWLFLFFFGFTKGFHRFSPKTLISLHRFSMKTVDFLQDFTNVQ